MTITDEGVRIEVPFTDSLHRRDVVCDECWLRLHEAYMEYKIVAVYESDDRHDMEGMWTETTSNYRWTRMRSDLSQVDMYYDNPSEKWMVSIEFRGVTDPTGWMYNSPKEAKRLYDQLQDYFISR